MGQTPHARIIVLAAVLLNAVALWPEIAISRFDLNDSVFHLTMADRVVQTLEHGENPLDFWVPEWTLGYPVSRTYQPLGHLVTAGLYLALLKTVSLTTVFAVFRYLLIVLLPLTVYVAGRQLNLTPPAAAAAALISPLVSTDGLFGIEYGSYVWYGSGLFTQALAMHFLLLAIGATNKTMRGGSNGIVAGVLLGLTFLTHFIYGYIGALTGCLIAALPNTLSPPRRAIRLLVVAAISLCISAFELVPALIDSPLVNHSRWEPAWKWDSFGAAAVMRQLLSGHVMDFGRLPVLSLLVLLGAVVCARRNVRVVLFGSVLWLLLFFGRPTWGGFFNFFAPPDIQLHRLIGGVHLFFIFTAGVGLAAVWSSTRRNSLGYFLIGALTIVILLPALRERLQYLSRGQENGETNLAALRSEQASIDQLTARLTDAPGRVYPGLAGGWGKDFRVGFVPMYAILSTHHIPAVAFLYHAMALTSDVMVLFDETNPAHYDLFNVSTVLSDGRPLPAFINETERIGRFHLAAVTPVARGGGYFEVVRVPYAVQVNKQNFYDVTANWLQSNWWTNRTSLLLDLDGTAPLNVERLSSEDPIPPVIPQPAAGSVESEGREHEQYNAVVNMAGSGYILFKMTYHPNWKAAIDGVPAATVMLTPGFIGVPATAGKHRVEMRYAPGPLKTILLAAGLACVGLIAVIVRRSDARQS